MKLDMKKYHLTESEFDRREAAPRFILKPHNCTAPAGQSARFECRVFAPSPPLVIWLKEDIALTQSVKFMQKMSSANNTYELKINRVKLEDKGHSSINHTFPLVDRKLLLIKTWVFWGEIFEIFVE